jgi:hypothetical protein
MTCSACRKDLPETEFHRDARKPTGRRARCRSCEYAARGPRPNRLRRPPADPEKDRARRRLYRRQHPEMTRASRRKSIEATPTKQRARVLLNRALRDGSMPRPDHCSECKETCIPHGHHEDYSQPFEVVWLCARCHAKRHFPRPAEVERPAAHRDGRRLMWCGRCNRHVGECICPDIKERLAAATGGGHLAMKWCRRCDQHHARCRCVQPDFYIKDRP